MKGRAGIAARPFAHLIAFDFWRVLIGRLEGNVRINLTHRATTPGCVIARGCLCLIK